MTDPANLSLSQSALDGLPDGILLIRADRTIAYSNPAFMKLWRVPAEIMGFKNDFALINHVLSQLIDPGQFINEVERLYSSQESSEDQLRFKDGRVFGRRSFSIADGDKPPARMWMFSDITPARQALAEPAIAAETPEARTGLHTALKAFWRTLTKKAA